MLSPAPPDLAGLRRTAGLAADDVAAALGVHPTTVLRWERGARLPGPVHVRALADVLGVPAAAVAGFFDAHRLRPDPSDGVVGTGLRALRRAAGLGAAALATRLGVPVATVYNWEAGRARVPGPLLPRLAGVLDVEGPVLLRALRALPATAPPLPVRPGSLGALRARARLSKSALARAVGVDRQTVHAWELRRARPALHDVRRLARALGVPVAEAARAAGLTGEPRLDPRRWRAGDLPLVLTDLRAWSGLTQRELATRLGAGVSTVRAWEAGRSVPADGARRRLEAAYGLPTGTLDAALGR